MSQPPTGVSSPGKRRGAYAGIFLIAFSSLALEITLTRLLSVATWYYLAFFAIATAMLGMTAGATTVFLRRKRYEGENLWKEARNAAFAFGLSIPITVIVACLVPVRIDLTAISLIAMLIVTLACTLPFYFSGIVITLALTRFPMPVGKVYAADLIGASLGCLLVLGGLELMDAPSLILLCGGFGFLSARMLALDGIKDRVRRWGFPLAMIFFAGAGLNSMTAYGIYPVVVKGMTEVKDYILLEKWNSFSRIAVYEAREMAPQYWGGSPIAPWDKPILQYEMNIDGSAGTTLRQFRNLADIDHLRYDLTNLVYHLRDSAATCIIGVGGARDVQSAILFGERPVTGVELNPIFIRLLEGRFRDFAGLAGRDDVSLIVDDARSYLSRNTGKFGIIQMSLIDTWAATGAGAFSLSENALYTTEAWKVFFDRLAPNGIFTVSRWYNPENPGETGRMLSLAAATLLEAGVEDPEKHMILASTGYLATLLLCRDPLSETDLEKIRAVCSAYQFELLLAPGLLPEHPVLRKIVSAASVKELYRISRGEPLDYTPATDDRPYFFNLLKLGKLNQIFIREAGIVHGNIISNLVLLALVLLLMAVAFATVLLPLWLSGRRQERKQAIFWPAAAYFSLIGAGFMFAEMAMIQKLSVFLGHPIYALGILLFTVIASAGTGSYVSEFLPLDRKPWAYLYPILIAAGILAMRFLLPLLMEWKLTAGIPEKAVLSVLMIFPLGFLMGFCFPVGMRMLRSRADAETPWYWALNGIFGVLCSALVVLVSIYAGIPWSFYLASAFYLSLLFVTGKMLR